MIRNIIFDMGNVLIRFEPYLFMERLGVPPEERDLLNREVFRSVEWVQLDHGTITEAEAVAQMCARVPEPLHDAVAKLVSHWDRPILPVEGMEELARELKEKGYGVYLLSNASRRQHEYWPRIPASPYFDGTLISADVGLLKPDPDIYRLLCETFSLVPEECCFIDDSPPNVEAARCCGWQGVVFHGDVTILRRELRMVGTL